MKLIRITAVWCVSCIYMNGLFNDIDKDILDKYEITDLDFDRDTEEVDKYKMVNTLPVYILMKDEEEIARSVGEKSKEELIKFLALGDEGNNKK